ncbi:phosphate uptake regulator PhoU [Candidatus Woesearchaeota archaeon]|nr:phosphate uptake regulator PhoU [Candidatus Woesearchaeota archaeon]
MKRKLVKQGVRALTITLPSAWVQKNNLNAGDEIDIDEIDNSITISTEKQQALKDIMVDVSGLVPKLADRFIARAYQKGYDKIVLNCDNQDILQAVKNKVTELMGFEILDIGKDKIEIQVISSNLNLDFDTLLRRAFLILMDMAKTCEEAWKANDKKALENIFYQDFDVNKFTYFCLRELNKNQKRINFGKTLLYYLIESAEDLGDELKELGKILAGTKLDKDLVQLIHNMNDLFRISYEFFYTPKKENAIKAFKIYKQISTDIEKLYGTKDKELTKALVGIDFSNRIIYHFTTMRLDTLKELSGEKE